MPFPRKIKIDQDNSKGYTDLEFHELISLTGIEGYANFDTHVRFIEAYFYETDYDEVHIDIECKFFRLYRTVHLKALVIRNESFQVKESMCRTGIGTSVLLSQINHARQMGFKVIELTAQKAYINGQTSHVGHIVWAKLGFTMTEKSREDFSKLLIGTKYASSVTNIFDLITKDIEAENFWATNGKTWRGRYDLTANSENELIFYYYRSRKCRCMKERVN